MIGYMIVTLIVAAMSIILGFELITFWDDRTVLGNFMVGTAILLAYLWFGAGLYQLWR